MTTIQSINPYTREVNASFETLTDSELTKKIELAHKTFLTWKNTSFAERKKLFLQLADLTLQRAEENARLQTLEMGMLYAASLK